MDTREFPVLDDGDDLVGRLAVGLGDDAARVLAYLLRRRETDRFGDDPATRLAVRIGTSLNRERVAAALNRLEDRGLVATTALESGGSGRPPTAWHAPNPPATTLPRVDDRHAAALLDQARVVAAALGESPVEASGTSAERTEFEPFRLGLNWHPNPLQTPFLTAMSAGEYEKAGIEVVIDHHRGSGEALRSLTEGATDVALAGAATVLRTRAAGEPILPVAVVFQRAMATLYTTRRAFGGAFETIAQLRGRRVGLSRTSETGLLARMFLSQAGVLDDVTVVDIAGEERTALRSGRAAVVAGSFADPRRVADTRTVDSILVADRFPMYGPTVVTTETTLRKRHPALRRFLAGTVAGWGAAVAPRAGIEPVAGEESDDEPALDDRRTFEHAVAAFGGGNAVEDHGWGWQEVAGWERLETALDRTGLLGAVP